MSIENIAGMRIISSPVLPAKVPKLMLHPDVVVSEEFRASMNQWLLDMFGERPAVFMLNDQTIITHPSNVDALRRMKQ